MGTKIIKLFFIFLISICCICPCCADNIPTVRVGISDTSFKKLSYSEITIFGTEDFSLYEKNNSNLLAKFNKDDFVQIIYHNGKFDIEKNNQAYVKNYPGTIIVHSPNGLLGINGLKRKSKQALYHGIFELIPRNEREFFIVNVLDLQEYLKGVVPNEMPVSFGLEALKAQAVAARNYVLMPRTRAYKEFDVDDSVASQVYFGANTEAELANQAVNETIGLVALYNWNMILAQYCSTAGGYTEDYSNAFSDRLNFPAPSRPYLKGKPDIINTPILNNEEDARIFYMSMPNSYDMYSPYYRWKKEFERAELENTLKRTLVSQSKTGFVYPSFTENQDFGDLKELRVLKRGVSGKVMDMEIITTKGTWRVSKELVIRRVFQKNNTALPSANVVFEPIYDDNGKLKKILAFGGGYGHGVGMSQFGAGFMAKNLNKNFVDILKHYYSDITISTAPQVLKDNRAEVTFYAPEKNAVIVMDNQNFVKVMYAVINGENVYIPIERKRLSTEVRIDISKYIVKGKNDIVLNLPPSEKGKHFRFYIELVKKDD